MVATTKGKTVSQPEPEWRRIQRELSGEQVAQTVTEAAVEHEQQTGQKLERKGTLAVGEFRVMKSRYPGKCMECGASIAERENVWLTPNPKQSQQRRKWFTYCGTCGPQVEQEAKSNQLVRLFIGDTVGTKPRWYTDIPARRVKIGASLKSDWHIVEPNNILKPGAKVLSNPIRFMLVDTAWLALEGNSGGKISYAYRIARDEEDE